MDETVNAAKGRAGGLCPLLRVRYRHGGGRASQLPAEAAAQPWRGGALALAVTNTRGAFTDGCQRSEPPFAQR